ncbi:nitroreductase [Bradyrhizobium sp. JR4.1]
MSRDSRPAVRTFSPRTSTCWAAPQRPESRRRCWTRNETRRDEHVSEYKYYASDLPDPYLERRQEFGRLFYGSLGIGQADAEARSRQTANNYTFFGAPVGLIVTIDRRLETGSWLDLGMFLQNVMLAAAGRGLRCPQETFSKYRRILRPLLSIPDRAVDVFEFLLARIGELDSYLAAANRACSVIT